ncbi:MAG: G1 family glutamic endopeptidase [Solirubrobacteraceae bacterium]
MLLNYARPPTRWRRRRFLHARAARRLTLLLACTGGLAVCPASALADTSTSANWSGYVVHRTGVSFRRVQASWTQPNATCQEGDATYSAFWVGLGGYSSSSDALEQIGTELDCSASGTITSSAWYELVPSPMNSIRMTVKPGDRMSASVVVLGHRVTLRLTDQTEHESFSKQITAKSVDTSSADWIAEAPSACTTTNFCEPLPLTNFGSMLFTAARARTTEGFEGPIASSAWDTTKIALSSGGRVFIGFGTATKSSPSPLLRSGTSFQVSYSQSDATPSPPPFYSRNRLPGHPNDTVQPGGKRR